MTEIPIDPRTRRVIVPAFKDLVDAVLAGLRGWTARRRAARVARELEAALPEAELRRLGLAHRGGRS